jgi:hypothetical protein
MADVTVQTIETPEGCDFLRSDGLRFFLVGSDNGSATLYKGVTGDALPAAGILCLDVNISDKVAAARRWVLAYPEHPS